MNYYERHLGDYAKDTGHLSILEHGAYTLLLRAWMWPVRVWLAWWGV